VRVSGEADPEIIIRLPLSAWKVVYQHLQAGPYRDVAAVLMAISEQAQPQIQEAESAAALRGQPEESTTTTQRPN
jgi:hypothetical protein